MNKIAYRRGRHEPRLSPPTAMETIWVASFLFRLAAPSPSTSPAGNPSGSIAMLIAVPLARRAARRLGGGANRRRNGGRVA